MGRTFRGTGVLWNSCPRNRYLHIPLCSFPDGIERRSISNYCFSRSSPWQPILTPGEPQTIELQNAEMLGRWGNLPPRLFSGRRTVSAPIPEANCQQAQQANWRGWTGTKTARKLETEKKKGGAMNAPPLKGSDTSVSSPKRQTAEAVRRRASRERWDESSHILHARYSHGAQNRP